MQPTQKKRQWYRWMLRHSGLKLLGLAFVVGLVVTGSVEAQSRVPRPRGNLPTLTAREIGGSYVPGTRYRRIPLSRGYDMYYTQPGYRTRINPRSSIPYFIMPPTTRYLGRTMVTAPSTLTPRQGVDLFRTYVLPLRRLHR